MKNLRISVALAAITLLIFGIIYPAAMTGRAMAVFTMALFMGVALMQWVTGVAASVAAQRGADPYGVVMLTIAGLLAAGLLAFRGLPAPAR